MATFFLRSNRYAFVRYRGKTVYWSGQASRRTSTFFGGGISFFSPGISCDIFFSFIYFFHLASILHPGSILAVTIPSFTTLVTHFSPFFFPCNSSHLISVSWHFVYTSRTILQQIVACTLMIPPHPQLKEATSLLFGVFSCSSLRPRSMPTGVVTPVNTDR